MFDWLIDFVYDQKEWLYIGAAVIQLISAAFWGFSLWWSQKKENKAIREKVDFMLVSLETELKVNERLLANFYKEAKERKCENEISSIPLSNEVFKQVMVDAHCVRELSKKNILGDLWQYETILRILKNINYITYYKKLLFDFANIPEKENPLERLIENNLKLIKKLIKK